MDVNHFDLFFRGNIGDMERHLPYVDINSVHGHHRLTKLGIEIVLGRWFNVQWLLDHGASMWFGHDSYQNMFELALSRLKWDTDLYIKTVYVILDTVSEGQDKYEHFYIFLDILYRRSGAKMVPYSLRRLENNKRSKITEPYEYNQEENEACTRAQLICRHYYNDALTFHEAMEYLKSRNSKLYEWVKGCLDHKERNAMVAPVALRRRLPPELAREVEKNLPPLSPMRPKPWLQVQEDARNELSSKIGGDPAGLVETFSDWGGDFIDGNVSDEEVVEE
jgi:hypothetical protein